MAEKGFGESPWVALSSIIRRRKARTGKAGGGALALLTMYNLTPPGSEYNLWVCAGWQPPAWERGHRNEGGNQLRWECQEVPPLQGPGGLWEL